MRLKDNEWLQRRERERMGEREREGENVREEGVPTCHIPGHS